MRLKHLDTMTSQAVVDEYVAIGMRQDQAIEQFDNRTFNRLVPRQMAIAAELKSRAGDERRLLVPLLEHPNWQVKLNAAHDLLVVAPEIARATLEAIALSKHYPHAGDAGMSLRALEQGIFKPV